MYWLLETVFGLVKLVLYTLWGAIAPICLRFKKNGLPDLSADVCVVTGAGRGLGRELAIKFAKCGATTVLWDVDEDNLKTVTEEIRETGRDVHYYVCDCSNNEQVQRTADRVREEVGDVAILINNAGIVTGKSVLESSEEEIRKVMEVNALAHFWVYHKIDVVDTVISFIKCITRIYQSIMTAKAFLPWMIQNNYGYIISIASVLAFGGLRGVSDYSASKAAVVNFTESLRYELIASKKNGITVSCICPYHMNTGMFEGVKTRFPRILSALEPSMVAERTVRAVVAKETLVIIPSYFRIIFILKWILPTRAYDEMLNIIGANEAMKLFVGHQKRK